MHAHDDSVAANHARDAGGILGEVALDHRQLERAQDRFLRLALEQEPERRLDEIGADSIDMVELLVVIDSDFGVRLKEDEFLRLVTVEDLLQLIVDRSPEHAL